MKSDLVLVSSGDNVGLGGGGSGTDATTGSEAAAEASAIGSGGVDACTLFFFPNF
jgi:hypothetical protein